MFWFFWFLQNQQPVLYLSVAGFNKIRSCQGRVTNKAVLIKFWAESPKWNKAEYHIPMAIYGGTHADRTKKSANFLTEIGCSKLKYLVNIPAVMFFILDQQTYHFTYHFNMTKNTISYIFYIWLLGIKFLSRPLGPPATQPASGMPCSVLQTALKRQCGKTSSVFVVVSIYWKWRL